MNKYAKLIIAGIGILIAAMLFCGCDKSCYECNVEHQFFVADSIPSKSYWNVTNIDSTFTLCGYDVDAYSGKIIEINPGIERTYNHCNKK